MGFFILFLSYFLRFLGLMRYLRDSVAVHRLDRLILCLLFLGFSSLYIGVAWLVCGAEAWWILDFINGTNVFYGDDAYRFFLARSAWLNSELYTYNFVLPVALVLDGVVVSITGGDLFLSRSMHAVLGAAALCFVWDSGRQLGINRVIITAAVIIMGLVPRFVFTTLSFYGEFWLGFLVCLILWLFLRRYFFALAIAAGILPLVRPEGIYFFAFVWFFLLKNRRWREAALMLMPGCLYAAFLVFNLPALSDYHYWRQELRRILVKIPFNKGSWEIIHTYSWLVVVPALFGFCFRPVRRLWPLLIGAACWLLMLQGLALVGLATYEERYTYSLIPVLIILWASAVAWAWSKLPQVVLSDGLRAMSVVCFAVATVFQGLWQLDSVALSVRQRGIAPVIEDVLSGRWERIFSTHEMSAMNARVGIGEKIIQLLEKDKGVDFLIIQDPIMYYKLDPHAIPAHVRVGYPATTYMVFHLLLDGQIYVQHPGMKMYSYLRFGKPDFRDAEQRALYVDLMPLQGYPYTWRWNGIYYELYLFSYVRSLQPEVNIESRPLVHGHDIERAYRQWLDY